MRIWWCQEHELSSSGPGSCSRGRWDSVYEPDEGAKDCRLVPMRLIPDNTLPTVEELRQALIVHENEIFVDPVIVTTLQALVALDGETP